MDCHYHKTLILKLRLPNIKVNESFSQKVSLSQDCESDLIFTDIQEIIDFEGLAFDPRTFILSGKVDKAGTHDFTFQALLKQRNGKTRNVEAKLKVTFIPDPRSLWNNIPSNSNLRFHKPDEYQETKENSYTLLMASSVRGRSHAHKGTHRDDDFHMICNDSSEWSVISVADGAGSCKYSRQGAYLAASVSAKNLKEALNGHYGSVLESAHVAFDKNKNDDTNKALVDAYHHTMVSSIFKSVQAIRGAMVPEESDVFKDYSTTLLVAAYKKVEGGHLVFSFWIGDGAAVIYQKNKEVIVLGTPDSGEYAGQTRFLDDKIFEDNSIYGRIKLEKVQDITAIILATDGITDAKFEVEKELEDVNKWDNLWSEIEPYIENPNRTEGLSGLTDWMGFWSKGNHDDRTISICRVKD